MRNIIRYLFPPRKLHRVPRVISAEYERQQMTPEQQIIIMAGLARDPAEAGKVFHQLENEHGTNVFRHIHLRLRRKRTKTAGERFMMLLRRALGEAEPRKYERHRPIEPIVKTNYAHKEINP